MVDVFFMLFWAVMNKIGASIRQGFTLEFHFDENEYFTNKVLTKKYLMRSAADENDPLGFDGPEIISCTG